MAAVESPDQLVLREKPNIGSRLGSRGGMVIMGVGLLAIVTVIASIESRRQHSSETVSRETKNPKALVAANAAPDSLRGITDNVPDGIPAVVAARREGVAEGKAELSLASPPAPAMGAAPDLTRMRAGQGGAGVPQLDVNEGERKLAEERERQEQEARKAGLGTGSWASPTGEGGDAVAGGATASPLADRQAQLMQQMQDLSKGMPSAAAMAGAIQGQGQEQTAASDQKQKNDWLTSKDQLSAPILAASRKAAPSDFYLATGTVLNAVTLEQLVSDLPGEMRGMLISPVYDSATGIHLLIPTGTMLFGTYDSSVAFGQDRAQVCWQRLVFPDASTLELGCMKGNDQAGAAGFEDKVNNHIGRLVGYGVLTSVMGAAFQLSQPQPKSSANGAQQQLTSQQVVAGSIGQELSQLGAEVTRRNLNVQPTITIRSGYRFVVKVNRDIVFPGPYEP